MGILLGIVVSVHKNEVIMKKRIPEGVHLFRIFHRICDRWELTEEEQLGLLNMKNAILLNGFKSGKMFPPEDIFRRIGYLLNIYKSLHILLPDAYSADTWIRRPNAGQIFNRKPAIKLMVSDESGIKKVHDYLMCQRYGLS